MEVSKLIVAALPEPIFWAPSYTEKNQQIWSKITKCGDPKANIMERNLNTSGEF